MNALHLRRTDPARNMCRFYRLDIQPDLFGRVLLTKQWGRVGTQGRMMIESYDRKNLPPSPCSGRPSARGGGDMPRQRLGIRRSMG
jgi:WGR domain